MEILPSQRYLDKLDRHQPQFDLDMIKELLKQVGFSTPDERIYKMVSLYMSNKLNDILLETQEMQHTQAQLDAKKKQKNKELERKFKESIEDNPSGEKDYQAFKANLKQEK